jgi:dUTP pyrophosphatase
MLKVKLLHPDAKPPTVSHAGSDIGFDVYALEDVVLRPGILARVRTGIAVEGPAGYGFVLGDRSSMALKGVTYLGGRIDAGYRGEILVCLMNVNQPQASLRVTRNAEGVLTDVRLELSDASVALRKGDRIIQMSLFRADTDRSIEIVDELSESTRAAKGFGSSGR